MVRAIGESRATRWPVLLGWAVAWCGCCAGLPLGVLHAQTAAPASRSYLLQIQGMTCESCAARVQKALAQVPGVAEAKVNYGRSEAHVLIQQGKTVRGDTLVKAVEKASAGTQHRYQARVKQASAD